MADAIVLTRPLNSGTGGGGSGIAGMSISTINGQPMLTLEDTTRANKVLSVGEQELVYAENQLSNLDWIRIGTTNNADTGFIADFDGTIVNISAHCENTGGNSKDIRLFVDATDVASLGILTGGANATINDTTLNHDFLQGQRIRLRAVDGTPGNIQDTVIKLTIKWRLV